MIKCYHYIPITLIINLNYYHPFLIFPNLTFSLIALLLSFVFFYFLHVAFFHLFRVDTNLWYQSIQRLMFLLWNIVPNLVREFEALEISPFISLYYIFSAKTNWWATSSFSTDNYYVLQTVKLFLFVSDLIIEKIILNDEVIENSTFLFSSKTIEHPKIILYIFVFSFCR